jgi:hypothetical protein
MEVVNLHDALVALAGFEGDEVSIDMNGDTVKPLAYPWFGPKSHVEPPAFLNFWSFNAERRPPNRTRILDYSRHGRKMPTGRPKPARFSKTP